MLEIKSKFQFKHLLIGAASATALLGSMSSAQAEETKTAQAKKKPEIEIIEVSGFRSSLSKAMNIKRTSSEIVDAISSEDIGKSSDQNIAEALQRVTGISISRQDGEGTTVTARGISSSLNVTTLNGVPLTSSGTGQGVNFSEFSSDVLNNIEVQKTPSASTDEGSLGATIKLSGFKPLDAKKDRRIFEVQERYNDFSHDSDQKIQFSASEKFLDETLGLSIVATSEEQGTRKDLLNLSRWRTIKPPVGATNIETGEIVKTWDYDGDGVQEPLELRQASTAELQTQHVQRDRTSVSGTIQYIPWEDGEFRVDATYTSQDIERDNAFISQTTERTNFDAASTFFDPNTFTVINTVKTAMTQVRRAEIGAANPGVTIPGKVKNVGVIRNQRQINIDNQETKVLSLAFEQSFEGFELALRGGRSESEKTPEFNLRGFFRGSTSGTAESGVENGYNCVGGDLVCNIHIAPSGYVDNAEGFEYQSFNNSGNFTKDISDSFYADLVWDQGWSFITSVETGFKYTDREKETNNTFSTCNRGCVDGELNNYTLADFTSGNTSGSIGKALGLTSNELTDGFPIWDIQTTLDFLEEINVADKIAVEFTDIGSKTIQQKIIAAYLQVNFEFMDGRLSGNLGVRSAKTEVTGIAASTFRFDANQSFMNGDNIAHYGSREATAAALGYLVGIDQTERDTASVFNTADHDYTNVLPSLNLNYAFSEDIILRFAASETIARPRFDRLAPTFNISENLFGEFSSGNAGRVDLNPFKSSNLDLSAEWYFNKSSLLSVAFFNKDLSDFEERSQTSYYWKDLRSEYFDVNAIVDPTVDRAPRLDSDAVTYNPTVADVLLPFDGGDNQAGCMPNRELDMSAPSATEICDKVLLTEGRNGSGGYVRGMEFSLQHNFDYLPGIFGGLGGVINYTYADSKTDEESIFSPTSGEVTDIIPSSPLLDTSEHTLNATVFWEQDGNLIRLAYNQRSDYLTDRAVNDYGMHWIEGFNTLDLSGSWKVNESVSLNFQASNLLDTVTRMYSTTRLNISGSNLPGEASELGSQPTGRTVQTSNTGTIYRIGLRFSF
ncbi:MAG: TonB-dependent receptor [Thalassotalea sp.]